MLSVYSARYGGVYSVRAASSSAVATTWPGTAAPGNGSHEPVCGRSMIGVGPGEEGHDEEVREPPDFFVSDFVPFVPLWWDFRSRRPRKAGSHRHRQCI